MTLLEEAFEKENYVEISFSFNGAGHPTIPFTLNNETVTFLLDTGAASNILDLEFCKKRGFPLTSTGQKGGGAGGLIHDTYSTGTITFFYKNIEFSHEFYAMEFNSIKQALKAHGIQDEIRGILGFDFLKPNSSFIDYSKNRIFVKPVNIT